MKRSLIGLAILLVLISGCYSTSANMEPTVQVVPREKEQRVDILVDEQPFTSYIYSDTITVLKKPVLFPIRTSEGTAVTRGYPLQPKLGEAVDHPHQVGLWFSYGSVNGLDFWNNSAAIPPERAGEMGTVRHRTIEGVESGTGKGELTVTADWVNSDGDVLLDEETRYVFHANDDARMIDRITTLTAANGPVSLEDNKEGVFGMRLTRQLEMPAPAPIEVVGPNGTIVEDASNEGVSGSYVNSEGIRGYPDVWGKRARWTSLSGVVDGDSVTVAILDHPSNVGFPTYWHARDYGLFAANPLGQAVFTEGRQRLGFTLDAGESVTFTYRVVILNGNATPARAEAWYRDFAE